MIYGDQKAAQVYYFTTVKEIERIEEEFEEQNKTLKLEPDGEFKLFVLDMQKPNQTIKIGKSLPIAMRMKFTEILVEYKDIFVWSSSNLGIVPRSVAKHKLNIPEGTKLTFQKKRAFVKARQEIIKKEAKDNYLRPVVVAIPGEA